MYSKSKIYLVAWILLSILDFVTSAPSDVDSEESTDPQGRLFRWIAIGSGALINIVIGGYAGLTNILETEGRWTQRLEFVKDENKWWAGISLIVLLAFSTDVAAFSKGESVDATILLLAAEVGIVIFVYVVQGTLHSEYRHILWLAWTGKSRTGCDLPDGAKMRDILSSSNHSLNVLSKGIRYESKVDLPGYGSLFSTKIKKDLTTVLRNTKQTDKKTAPEVFGFIESHASTRKYVYPQHRIDQSKVSILWGGVNCDLFSIRASRGITGYTLERIRSSFSLINVDEMKWMFVAGGIVSRNKGLYPKDLIYGLNAEAMLTDEVETTSKWRPRPSKTSRSKYAEESGTQFSGLGPSFCAAVVEIALLMQDIPNNVLIKALKGNVEQQSSRKMWQVRELIDSIKLQDAMYVCQYMTLCAKLNWYGQNNTRPDLLMGMMYASYKGWDYTINGNEERIYKILKEELEGLDLDNSGKTNFDILMCLGSYLGIHKGNRKDVIVRMSSKFSQDEKIQSIFSNDVISNLAWSSETTLLDKFI
ncbi:hypothetical protein BGZ76_001133 [Entomortierella beljakovae]|nr:hypothetical protein BGZ76_001133 [Entomortierella beljakovae]